MPDQDSLLRAVVDTIPSYIFVTDHEARIVYANRAAVRFLGDKPPVQLQRLCGEVIRCIHERDAEGDCGTTPFCKDCVVRKGVESVRNGQPVFQEKTRMKIEVNGEVRDLDFFVTASPINIEEQPLILLVLEDITDRLELRSLLPICAGCKKIRDEQTYWEDVEAYIAKHTDLRFTHGLCPDCVRKFFPDAGHDGK